MTIIHHIINTIYTCSCTSIMEWQFYDASSWYGVMSACPETTNEDECAAGAPDASTTETPSDDSDSTELQKQIKNN